MKPVVRSRVVFPITVLLLLLSLAGVPASAERVDDTCTQTVAGDARVESHSSRDLLPILQIEDAVYPVGAPVKIRVGYRNTSSKLIGMTLSAPWDTTSLTLTSSDGSVIEPGMADFEKHYPSISGFGVWPGACAFASWNGQSWWDISRWGYGPLPAGDYVLTAQLKGFGVYARVEKPNPIATASFSVK